MKALSAGSLRSRKMLGTMKRAIWQDLLLLSLGVLAVQSSHLLAQWDESLWGMEGTFYGIGIKNFSRFDVSVHKGLLVQNGSPDVAEAPRYYARALMPYYWAEGACVALLGDREWAYRLVPAFHGMLMAVFLYLLVSEVSGRRVALWTGFFAGASPMVGYYSTCTYSGAAACYLPGTMWALLGWSKKPHPRRRVFLVALVSLAWFGNYFNLFFLPAFVFFCWRTTPGWFRIALMAGVTFLGVHLLQISHFLLVDPTLEIFFGNVSEWWIRSGGDKSGSYSPTLIANAFYTLARLMTPVSLALAGSAVFLLPFSPKRFPSERLAVLSIVCLLVPGVAILLVFPGHTLIHEHDFYWWVPGIAWLAALGLDRLAPSGIASRFLEAPNPSQGSGVRKTWLPLSLFAFAFAVAAGLFYRGDRTCWYHPGHTVVSLVLFTIPVVVLLFLAFSRKEGSNGLRLFFAAWLMAAVFYSSTLQGDRTRVYEALFIHEHTNSEDRVAVLTRVYPLDLYYSERCLEPVPVPSPSPHDPDSFREALKRIRKEGFDFLFVSSRAAVSLPPLAAGEEIRSGSMTLIHLPELVESANR